MQNPFSKFKITLSIADFDSETLTYRLQAYLDGVAQTPQMAIGRSKGLEKGGGYWPVYDVQFRSNENVTILTDEKIIQYSNRSGVFPHDKYYLTLYVAVKVDEPYHVTNGWVKLPSTNYVASYNISAQDWDTLPEEIPPWFQRYGGKYLYRLDLSISHSEEFIEYADIIFNQIPQAFWILVVLLGIYLVLHTTVSYKKNREVNLIPYMLICNGILLFLPIYMLSIRKYEEPLPLTPAGINLMNLLKMFLILMILGITVIIVDRIVVRTILEKTDSS